MTTLRTALAAAFLVAGLAGCGYDYAKAGKDAIAGRDFAAAVNYLRIAADVAPNDQDVRYDLAYALLRYGRTDESERLFVDLVRQPAYSVRAMKELIGIQLRSNRFAEAYKTVEDARRDAKDQRPFDLATASIQEAEWTATYAKVASLFDNHLGEGGFQRVRWLCDRLVTAPETGFPETLTTAMTTFQRDYRFTDREALSEVMTPARRARAVIEATWRRLLAEDPTCLDARTGLAGFARPRGNVEEVKEHAMALAKLRREDIADPERRSGLGEAQRNVMTTLGQALEAAGQIETGIALLEEARQNLETPEATDEFLARFYFRARQYAKLEALATRWFNRDASQQSSFFLGYAYYGLGRYDEALVCLDRAQGRNARLPDLNYALGVVLNRLQHFQRAVTHLELAREDDPRSADVVLELVKALEGIGEPERAKSTLRNALETTFAAPTSDDHKRLLAKLVSLFRGDAADFTTVEQGRRALTRDPGNPWIALHLAKLEFAAGNSDNARRLAQEVNAKAPEIADGWRLAAELALAAGLPRDTLRVVDRLDRLAPDDAAAPSLRARALLALSQTSDAIAAAEEALRRQPDDPAAASTILDALVIQKDWRRAIDFATPFATKLDRNAGFRRALARAHAALGEWEPAAAHFAAAAAVAPPAAADLVDHGECLLKATRLAEAAPILERALAASVESPALLDRAAEGLFAAADPSAVVAPLTAAAEKLGRGPTQTRILALIARARSRNRDQLGFLGTILELRRAQQPATAANLFVPTAVAAGALDEAAAVADVAIAAKALSGNGLVGALRAYLATGQWQKAIEAARAIQTTFPEGAAEARIGEARAMFGLEDKKFALDRLSTIVAGLDSADAIPAFRAALRFLVATKDTTVARDVAERAVPLAGRDGEVHFLAARAQVATGDLDRAATLLGTAVRDTRVADDAQALLAAVLLTKDRPDDAMKAVAAPAGPKSARVRDFLAAVTGAGGEGAKGFALALVLARRGELARAVETIMAADDLPVSWRSPLADHLARGKSDPAVLAAFIRTLARTTIQVEAGAFADAAIAETRTAEDRSPQEKLFYTLWRAWLHLRYDQPVKTAEATSLCIENRIEHPLVGYLHALAALDNAGPGSLGKIVANLYAADVPGPFAADLADELRRRAEAGRVSREDAAKIAADLLSRARTPVIVEVLVARTEWALFEGETAKAAESARLLPEALRERPRYRTAILLAETDAGSPEAKAAALRALDGPAPANAADALRRLELAVAAGAFDRARPFVEAALELTPYDAWLVHRCRIAVDNRRQLVELRNELEDCLTVIDPRATLRAVPRPLRSRPAF